MTLAQLFNLCNKNSYFNRDEDEIWAAINSAALDLYQKTITEHSGYFITWDLTTVALALNVEEYLLPTGCESLIRVRERQNVSDSWRVVPPADINAQSFTDAAFSSDFSQADPISQFQYYGPYELQADAKAQTWNKRFKFAPVPQEARLIELVFNAKFFEITGPESFNVIDPNGHTALEFGATAILLGKNDDTNAERFEAKCETATTQYLKVVRARQNQKGRTVEPYVEDMD